MIHFAAHVDWLTVTSRDTSKGGESDVLQKYAQELFEQEVTHYKVRDWAAHGYKGLQAGAVVVAAGQQGLLVQASGKVAERLSQALPVGVGRPSRVDLALTVWGGGDPAARIGGSVASARAAAAVARGPRARRVVLLDGGPDGATLTIGSRSSQQYGRMYDKHKESHDDYYEGAVRFEVEYKGETAQGVAAMLPKDGERSKEIAARVGSWFGARGVAVPVEVDRDAASVVLPSTSRPSDIRRLEWIARSVAPVVEELLIAVGPEKVYAALGLSLCEDKSAKLS